MHIVQLLQNDYRDSMDLAMYFLEHKMYSDAEECFAKAFYADQLLKKYADGLKKDAEKNRYSGWEYLMLK